MNPILEARGLQRRAPESSTGWLLYDINLTIQSGERLAICGKSGAGKSLLLRALAMLDQVEGSLLWHGNEVTPKDVPLFRSQVMYLGQRSGLAEGTVEEQLQLPFRWAVHRNRRYDPQRICLLLQAVGRERSFLHKRTEDLSGGEVNLVALIRAVQLEPTVLLLDEPTAALDEEGTAQAEKIVDTWAQLDSCRVSVWVSHDTTQLARIADRFISLQAGRMVVDAGS